MEIADRVQQLATKIRQQKAGIETEEATKNAFVMPFISNVLGYDVFDPAEVVPEFTADVGIKKGEKIDYAITNDGQVQILVEVKKIHETLRPEHTAQLYRYFTVTKARIAILTNGEVYQFYTDLDRANLMDSKPYLVLDLSDIDATLLSELSKLAKGSFDVDSAVSAAGELKYVGQLKRVLAAQFKQPDPDWVKFLGSRVYEGVFTQRVREQFQPLVERAMRQFLNDQANDRLQNALATDAENEPVADGGVDTDQVPESPIERDQVVTTEDELEGDRVVRAIVCGEVSASRVVARDNKSYFSILLDDNNRRPIARLWFNRAQKYLGVFDEN
ncbi:MAG TPA: type I restriction enzyme HsdR N-terminal domain-containing protein, partial [Pseudonocardiaceae bacterium]|nr:type I restriction enzyme HsdR N-terminal domain-containing protein [Pseudonocardiaceae bacterium]